MEGKPEFNLQLADASNSQDEGDWTLVPAQGRRKTLPLSSKVSLRNRYDALGVKNEQHVSNGLDPAKDDHAKLIRTPTHIVTSAPRKVHKVLVIGDSLLRGTEASICCPENFSRQIYCLPGSHIHSIAKRLPNVVNATDYHPLLPFHVGSNDIVMKQLSVRSIH